MRRIPWAVLSLGRAGGGRAVGVIGVWAAWERLMLRRHPTLPARPGGLFRFRIQDYRGPEVRLADGTVVRTGDRIAELHFDNEAFGALRRSGRYSAWRAVHELRLDLAELGRRAVSGELGSVVALHGTALAAAAGGVLGFETRELPHDLARAFQRYFLAGIDAIYHPLGLDRLARARRRWPSEVWMSVARAAVLASRR